MELKDRSKRQKVSVDNKLKWAFDIGATFDYQQNWLKDESKYKLCVKARQIGMTTTISIEDLLDAIFNDEFVIINVSPSQRQSDRLMWYVNKAFHRIQKILGESIPLLTHKRDGMVFRHGSELWSLPNNPSTVMGYDADRVVIDEAGIFPTTEGRQIYEATMGSLAAKDGGMSLSGMPYGRGKFFFDQFEAAKKKENDFSLHEINWTERAKQDPKYKGAVEQQRQYLSKIQFAQTYECDFIDENIVLFPFDLLHSCVDSEIRLISGEIPYKSDLPIFFGIDFAKKQDKTSIVAVTKNGDRYKVVMIKNIKDNYHKQLELIVKLNENLTPQKIYIDETGPGVPMLDFLTQKIGSKVTPISFSAPIKERLMIDMKNMFVDGRIKLPEQMDLIDELHSIEKSVTDHGTTRYLAPRDEGGHADMAFALSMAVNQLEKTDFRFCII